MQPSRKIASNIFKGSLGNMIEWYDWYVYAAFAVYFSPRFFQVMIQRVNCWMLRQYSHLDF